MLKDFSFDPLQSIKRYHNDEKKPTYLYTIIDHDTAIIKSGHNLAHFSVLQPGFYFVGLLNGRMPRFPCLLSVVRKHVLN